MQKDTHNQRIAISFTPDNGKLREKAVILAEKLQLPCVENPEVKEDILLLFYSENGLALCQFYGRQHDIKKVLFVDFIHGKNGYRLAHNRTIKQPLAKAVGIKPGIRPVVLDATAGLGGDGFVLASLGCKVFLYERNPVVAALLTDGLERAQNTPNPQLRQIMKRITLCQQESFSAFSTTKYDTVYLDPMFPDISSKTAKKRSMEVLRQLTGDDQDQDKLLATAKQNGAQRIAVKRARHAPLLCNKKPDYCIMGKSCRYDIYLAKKSPFY